ncbi:hypothetical protein [Candidatus Enterococcus clewellii]|uniref:Uncharacterized protein n=1 Tax=Candidatus Enterococcus clewellii TaxID=1834193 RepID=A0A242K7Y6_9ENTE|nr:hypothetical protein [Enterococcus sp. 9E7_DIV0242]OTP17281.1 hypothetical protein A5888_001419 [Enterococcus sp. 9E7_DIV0242]
MELTEFEKEMYKNATASMESVCRQLELFEIQVLPADTVLKHIRNQVNEFKEVEQSLIEKYRDCPIMDTINAELNERVKRNEL